MNECHTDKYRIGQHGAVINKQNYPVCYKVTIAAEETETTELGVGLRDCCWVARGWTAAVSSAARAALPEKVRFSVEQAQAFPHALSPCPFLRCVFLAPLSPLSVKGPSASVTPFLSPFLLQLSSST